MPQDTTPNIPPFEPIAIIGIAVRGPGGIDSLTSLWDTLVERKSHCFPLAKDPRFHRRFNPDDWKALFDGIPDSENLLHSNLFEETPGLDRKYFSLSEREAAGMDVQQKLLLHVAHEALEDAGYSGAEDNSAFNPNTFGVYIATATDEVIQDPRDYDTDIYHLVRTERAFLSGQICYHFGLRGPSSSVDTVCSGSITAFNDACRALATGECNAAIAGGVHVVTPVSGPISFYSIKRAGFLDRTGQCKPFLQNGTGYSRSEGCGLVVMKRLSDALREGDRIHGVIRGLCIRSMASPKFISQPDGGYQSIALARAVQISGVDPATISYSEAHGPGTAKGDPAEVSSLCSVLAEHRAPDNVLVVGSIKGNVGHAEAASGAQSLAKVIAMFQRRRIPPQADFHTSRMNPTLRPYFDNYPMRIIEKEEDWNASPRIATVGNFGASGNAGFMVIEEGLSFSPEGRDVAKITPLPFIISAKDHPTLIKLIHRYLDWLKLPSTLSTPLSDISYAMTARRFSHPFTIAIQANSHNDIAQKLQERPPVVDTSAKLKPREVAFCFSGQGGERLDPHKSTLYNISASFADAVDMCFRIAETESLIAEEDRPMLELFALEYGLVQMWKSWGINPVALAGHSFGEYVALVCAGVLSVHDALKLLGVRAALIRARCSDIQSQMAAVRLPLADITKCLERQQSTRVELACINSDNSVTLAGTPEDLELFRGELVTAYPAARWQLLNTMTAAFHSRFMQPISQEFINACKEVEFHPPKQVVLSALLGRMCPVGDNALQQGDYLVRHCRETNRFGTAISDYQRQNMELEKSQADWLEIGSHSRIISFISLAAGQLKFPSHGKQAEQGWTTALDTFMSLFAAGHEVDFKGFHHDVNPTARHTDLPLYPFELEPHFYPVRRAAKAGALTAVQAHPPVPAKDLAPLLRNHVIAGYTLTPATTHLGLLLLAASTSPTQHEGRSAYRVTKFKVQAGFTNTTDGWVQVRTQLPSPDVQVFDHEDHPLITARVDKCKEQDLLDSISLYQTLILPMKSIKSLPSTDILRKEMAYSLFSHTVNYGAHGQVIDRAWIAEDGHQAWGYSAYKHDDTAKEGMPASLYDFSPMLLEAACQLVGFLINTSADRKAGEIFVTDELGECAIAIQRLYETKYIETYASYRLVDNGTAALGQVFAFDDQGQIITAFRDVRMARMKLHVLKRLIDRILKPEQQVVTSQVVADVQEYDAANDDFDEKVISILQSALRVAELPRDKPLGDLGLDSLTAIDVGVQLERLIPQRKDHLAIDPESTVMALIESLRPTPVAQVPQVTSDTKESSVKAVKVDEFEEKVTSVFRTALRLADLPRDKTLREVGLDAHAAVDIVVQLRRLVPNLPEPFVIDRQCTLPSLIQILRSPPPPASIPIPTPTVAPSVTESGPPILDNVSQEMMQAMSSNPETTQYAPGPTPILLIHDGGGTAFAYHSLRSLDRTVLGIHSTGLLEGKGIVNVMHAAHEYAAIARKYLEENCPEHSRLLIGGWSLGGTISLTMAALYPDLVSGVLVIDSTPPGVSGMNVDQAEAVLLHPWTRTDGIHGLVRKQLQNNTRALMANKEHETAYRSIKVPVYIICAAEPFQPPPSMNMDNLPATATTWLLSSKRPQIAEAAWKAVLGDCFVGATTIPGNHWTLFTPVNTITTTDAMKHGIDVLEKAENNFAMF